MRRSGLRIAALLAGVGTMCGTTAACRADEVNVGEMLGDARLYFTASLHWDGSDWLFVGSSVAAVAVAHDFDGRVRAHFAPAGPKGVMPADTNSIRDAIPAASMVVGTWLGLETAGFSAI